MKQRERTTAFFAAMLMAFGISLFDFEDASFENNQKEYLAIALGLLLMIIFYINYLRNRPQV
jgi:hypothetical protein